ncbi:MAG: helicase associated domain-containing protein, partial [Clostridia bacterium]|nr:helicase associated domain-containing protein [Clostridia bacterium]
IANIAVAEEYEYNGRAVRIGSIVSLLRRKYSKNMLSDEEIEFLNGLGMKWKHNKIEMLEAYYKEHGTLANIKPDTNYEANGKSRQIGQIVYRLRKEFRDGTLEEEYVTKLNQMGMVWDRSRKEMLRDYYKEHGTLANIKHSDTYNYKGRNIKIGAYIIYLRARRKAGDLPQKEVEELTHMGIKWCFDKIEVITAYYQEFGNINVPKSQKYIYKGSKVNIGNMLDQLKRAKADGLLDDEEIKALESMGIEWRRTRNINNFEVFEAYYKEYGTLENIAVSTVYNYNGVEIKLGLWVANLRRPERRDALTKEQIEMLNNMGFVWNARHKFQNPQYKPNDLIEK